MLNHSAICQFFSLFFSFLQNTASNFRLKGYTCKIRCEPLNKYLLHLAVIYICNVNRYNYSLWSIGELALSCASSIKRMQILRVHRINTKSQRAAATINIRPALLITIKYDCTPAIKRDSLFVRGKDGIRGASGEIRFVQPLRASNLKRHEVQE